MLIHLLQLFFYAILSRVATVTYSFPCSRSDNIVEVANKTTVDNRKTVHIAVILSQNNLRLFSMNKSRAAIELAIEEAEKNITKSLHFEVLQYADSK